MYLVIYTTPATTTSVTTNTKQSFEVPDSKIKY